MFIGNKHASFHLCWKENLVKHQKYYQTDRLDVLYQRIKKLFPSKLMCAFLDVKELHLEKHLILGKSLACTFMLPKPEVFFNSGDKGSFFLGIILKTKKIEHWFFFLLSFIQVDHEINSNNFQKYSSQARCYKGSDGLKLKIFWGSARNPAGDGLQHTSRSSCWVLSRFAFFNWNSFHARLNIHCEAWSYKKKKHKKVCRKSV